MNMKSLAVALALFSLVAVPTFAQSGSRGGAPAPSFQSAPVPSIGSGSRIATPLPQPSFVQPSVGSGTTNFPPQSFGSGTTNFPPQSFAQPVQGSGSRSIVPSQSFGVPSGSVISQPGFIQSAPIQSFSSGGCSGCSGCGGGGFSSPVYVQPSFQPTYSRRSFWGCGGGCR